MGYVPAVASAPKCAPERNPAPSYSFKEFEAEPDPSNAHDDGKRRVALARI
jgi:hypothetical protein